MVNAGDDVRVMIIDDHEVVRRGIAEVVERADGLGVVAEAGSVQEAIRRGELVRPDVALVDLRLPDGNSYKLCTSRTSERSHIPVNTPVTVTVRDSVFDRSIE